MNSELLTELRRLHDELGEPLKRSHMDEHGRFSSSLYQNEFESWSRANFEAGLPVNSSRSFSDEEVIDDLQRVAEEMGRTPPSSSLDEHGLFPIGTYKLRFGTYNDALRKAGLKLNHRVDLTDEELLEELRRLAEELDRTPTIDDVSQHSKFSERPYDRWETFADARQAAGLERYSEGYGYEIGEETLIHALQDFASSIGRTPWAQEMMDSGPYTKTVYQRHFGSWNAAVEAAGLSPNEFVARPGEQHAHWNGGPQQYGPGFNREKRQRVRDRDDNRCADCGKTSEKHLEESNVDLHVHHITPARQFDDPEKRNAMENLVTLCASCHKKWEGIPLRPDTRMEVQ